MTLLYPLLGLLAGIFLAILGLSWDWGVGFIGVGILGYILIASRSKNPLSAYRSLNFQFIVTLLLFSGVGLINGDLKRPFIFNGDIIPGYIMAKGVVIDKASLTHGDRYTVKIDCLIDTLGKFNPISNLCIIANSDPAPLEVGDVIMMDNDFRRIHNNPNSLILGDSIRWARQGINYVINTVSDRLIVIGKEDSFLSYSREVRDNLISVMERSSLSRPIRNFLISILTGDRAFLDGEIRDLYSKAGIGHVLALSGLHIAIISGIFLLVLFPFNFVGKYKWRLVLTMIFLWTYTFISGAAPSTIRACIMTSFIFVGLILERKSVTANGYLLAAFVILLFSPYDLFDIGFQLSFICVGAILLFIPPLRFINKRYHPFLSRITDLVLITLISTIITFPISAYYFGYIPLSFLSVNIILLPVFPIFISAGILYFVLEYFGFKIPLLADDLHHTLNLINKFLAYSTSDSTNILYFSISEPIAWLWITGFIILGMAFYRVRKWPCIAVGVLLIGFSSIFTFIHQSTLPLGQLLFTTHQNQLIIRTMSKYNAEQISFTFPRGKVSLLDHHDTRIICIDNDQALIWDSISPPDYILLCGGIRDNIESIIPKVNHSVIVIHPSIRRKRENEIMEEADSLGIPYHSLRISGPLKIELLR